MIEKIVQLMDIIVLIIKGDFMRRIIFLLFLVLLCGCTGSYKLVIDDNILKENIYVNVTGLNDYSNIISKDYYPFHNNLDIIYKKDIVNKNNSTYLNLEYEYKPEEFINSVSYSDCFYNRTYENNKDYYYIKMNNLMECYYGFDYDIIIETKNKVSYNNADKVSGNSYIWHVNEKNKNKVLIEIKVLKGKYKSTDNIFIFIFIGFVISIALLFYILYKKKSETRNEI